MVQLEFVELAYLRSHSHLKLVNLLAYYQAYNIYSCFGKYTKYPKNFNLLTSLNF